MLNHVVQVHLNSGIHPFDESGSTMEARVNGIVREVYKDRVVQLLTALAGASPFPIEIHEVALEQRGKPDVVVQRYRVPGNEVYDAGTLWTSSHHSKPPWGDRLLDSLSASIRLVKEAKAPSAKGRKAEVSIELWEREGYEVRYHLVKDGVTCDVMTPDGVRLHVLLYKLFRGVRSHRTREERDGQPPQAVESGQGTDDESVGCGDAHGPVGTSVMEVWTQIEDPSAGYEKNLDGIAWINGLLDKFGVELLPLREKRKVIQQQRNERMAAR